MDLPTLRRRGAIIGATVLLTWLTVIGGTQPGSAQAPGHASGLSGRWHLRYAWRCVNSPQNKLACAKLNGGRELAIMGIRHTTIAYQETEDFVSDAKGRFSGHGQEIILERKAHAPSRCDQVELPYNGTCRYLTQKRGFIAKGKTGRLDFFVSYSATIPLAVHHKAPRGHYGGTTSPAFDTGLPAVPGHLDARHYLALYGFKTVPRGITASYALVRR
jgi:hypothetical protein